WHTVFDHVSYGASTVQQGIQWRMRIAVAQHFQALLTAAHPGQPIVNQHYARLGLRLHALTSPQLNIRAMKYEIRNKSEIPIPNDAGASLRSWESRFVSDVVFRRLSYWPLSLLGAASFAPSSLVPSRFSTEARAIFPDALMAARDTRSSLSSMALATA